MRDGGKGDMPRPIRDLVQFDKNWDAIFKHKKEKLNEELPEVRSETQDNADTHSKPAS